MVFMSKNQNKQTKSDKHSQSELLITFVCFFFTTHFFDMLSPITVHYIDYYFQEKPSDWELAARGITFGHLNSIFFICFLKTLIFMHKNMLKN